MSEMRVYEAARKLNMSVDEVVGMLAGKGVDVKSPIAVISQEQFDEMLNSLTREPQDPPAKAPEQPAPAPTADTPVEKDRGRLTLVTPITAAKHSQDTGHPHESDEDEDTPTAGTAAKAEPVPPAREPSPEIMAPKSGDSTRKISYTAVGVSALALLGVIALAVAAVKNSRELGALSSTVQTNQSALNDARTALSDLKSRVETNRRLQARAWLSERSVTLEELATTMPGPNAERIRRLATSINTLTSGM